MLILVLLLAIILIIVSVAIQTIWSDYKYRLERTENIKKTEKKNERFGVLDFNP